MSEKENKSTTPKQMTLIVLIVIVFLLLLLQLSFTSQDDRVNLDRESCLSSGYIWSGSSQECYGNDSM